MRDAPPVRTTMPSASDWRATSSLGTEQANHTKPPMNESANASGTSTSTAQISRRGWRADSDPGACVPGSAGRCVLSVAFDLGSDMVLHPAARYLALI